MPRICDSLHWNLRRFASGNGSFRTAVRFVGHHNLIYQDNTQEDFRMSKRMLFTALALLVSLSSLTAAETAKAKPSTTKAAAKAEEAADKAPRLTIIEPVKDYGTVSKGEKLDWAFVVKNTGTTDLQIISA